MAAAHTGACHFHPVHAEEDIEVSRASVASAHKAHANRAVHRLSVRAALSGGNGIKSGSQYGASPHV
jgi:hypothetical protein